ncbi:hypothetical protein [Inquilinus sp. Marseille-Q2685]|uniref:hypothetical protein n=1 Tax=Inquilinus sp. Marseille-Q2685 TaxID=2866581 RepID=UPI001CE421D6|nr:hypothetical protein [Inquilinus sp. Marseille-Q2685]
MIRDGLRALQARDRALEKWLRTEVVAAYDEARADPSSLLTGEEVLESLTKLRDRTEKRR